MGGEFQNFFFLLVPMLAASGTYAVLSACVCMYVCVSVCVCVYVCVCVCVCDGKLVNTKSQKLYISYMSYGGTLIAHGP